MRRLQSFKTPSRLSEKLRFTGKNNSGNSTSSNNGIRFVPNVSASDSNEVLDASQKNFVVPITKKPAEEFVQEKLEKNKGWREDRVFISTDSIGRDVRFSETRHSITTPSDTAYTNTTVRSKSTSSDKDSLEQICRDSTNRLDGWSVLQLPKYLPENRKGPLESSEVSIPTLLQDMPSGSIGKITFLKNGEIDLRLNSGKYSDSILFKVNCISRGNSEQFITAFSRINELINLGRCDSLLIATPKI
ncbi:hypothetical protein OJ252_3642 [Cryptosporidium canis]|uniref:Uncharacterized protein n=1 Tax=Cryptosporidium canis TaxID=195482 RepID=A0ABQ8P1Q5_9CRYT|nr:hypothetical protein OJ252_3642 [Cryptosporidium canis]